MPITRHLLQQVELCHVRRLGIRFKHYLPRYLPEVYLQYFSPTNFHEASLSQLSLRGNISMKSHLEGSELEPWGSQSKVG